MKNETIDRYSKIAKDCFWEYHFSAEEIGQLFKSNNKREKQFPLIVEEIQSKKMHIAKNATE